MSALARFSGLASLAAALALQTSMARCDEAAAREYVRQALAHEAYGKQEISRHLLQAALLESPDYAPAHWHLGHVHVDGKWLPAADAQTATSQCDTLSTYRKLREEALNDPRREMSLARWCRRQGWTDHEKLHYSRIALNQTAHPRLRAEAQRQLDLVNLDGEVVSEEDLEFRQERAERVAAAMEKWRGRLEAWAKAIAGDNVTRARLAAEDLACVEDPAVIPVLESFVAEAGPRSGPHLVALLGRFSQHESTQALVRFAVQSPSEEVRDAAIAELKRRSFHDFVPMLLDRLAAPVHSQFSVMWTGQGFIRYKHFLVRRNADATYVTAFDDVVRPLLQQASFTLDNWWQSLEGVRSAVRSRNHFLIAVSQIKRRLQIREAMLARQNSVVLANNDIVVNALERTTGQVLGTDPAQWQAWWEHYNETESEKPTYYAYYPTASTYTITVAPVRRAGSCFSAGTPVWTETGLVPIESVQVGDRVLSQDLDSGELTYKLVLRTTALPPTSGTVRIVMDAESVDMTKAHVVWVQGEGWRMAKELEPGDRLHGLTGSLEVYSVDELPPELEVYNLVVADFNTFFVGESGMLVHDITYVTRRRPTTAIVPGYTPGDPRVRATDVLGPPQKSLVRQVQEGLRQ